ncbi:MAG: hypothetical protein HYV63_22165 [Candidatus Schekmanbacteria bacterium]|nr:hypothetical protein [Candidatus Schekmanbacteria bacterium]
MVRDRYIASLNEVLIRRQGDCAIIEYRESGIPLTQVCLGVDADSLTDQEILDHHNAALAFGTGEGVDEGATTAGEMPPGMPQIRYSKRLASWVARADVLRCVIKTDISGEVVIGIDDKELSLRELGALLAERAGFGMRLTFVPVAELYELPEVELLDDEDSGLQEEAEGEEQE